MIQRRYRGFGAETRVVGGKGSETPRPLNRKIVVEKLRYLLGVLERKEKD